jgi:hypothetical protein
MVVMMTLVEAIRLEGKMTKIKNTSRVAIAITVVLTTLFFIMLHMLFLIMTVVMSRILPLRFFSTGRVVA